jgi:hypothetical protein
LETLGQFCVEINSVDQKEIYSAAIRILQSALSVAHANELTEVVNSLLEDADRLMCVAAGDGYLPGIDLAANALLKTKAGWLSFPSKEAGAGGVTFRANLMLWQVAILARQGRFQEAKQKFAVIAPGDGWEPDLDVIRTAVDAGIAHWHHKAFFKEVEKCGGAGLGYLIDGWPVDVGSNPRSRIIVPHSRLWYRPRPAFP